MPRRLRKERHTGQAGALRRRIRLLSAGRNGMRPEPVGGCLALSAWALEPKSVQKG